MTDREQAQAKKIKALQNRLRRTRLNLELWKHRYQRDVPIRDTTADDPYNRK